MPIEYLKNKVYIFVFVDTFFIILKEKNVFSSLQKENVLFFSSSELSARSVYIASQLSSYGCGNTAFF